MQLDVRFDNSRKFNLKMIATMKKIYVNPMLQVINVRPMDIVTASQLTIGNSYNGSCSILAPGERGLDDWDVGY